MTLVTTQALGYLDGQYLTDPYLSGENLGNSGLQFTVFIDAQTPNGVQFTAHIDAQTPAGLQFEAHIDSSSALGLQYDSILTTSGPEGVQFQGVISKDSPQGLQFEAHIDSNQPLGAQFQGVISKDKPTGLQFSVTIVDYLKPYGLQFRKDTGLTTIVDCGGDAGYLDDAYLTGPYLAATNCGHIGLQFLVILSKVLATGLQFEAHIDASKTHGMQFQGFITKTPATGLQYTVVESYATGMQWTVVLYNTDNLRILCDFPSRGLSGTNWTSNSTAAGDFNVNNLNTDIVEQVWRSNSAVTGVRLICDTEIPQGVFIDTLAILGHNFTSSANVVVEGSNVSDFSTIGTTIPMPSATQDTSNTYYIAPTYPLQGFRYWRISIDDAGNPDGFLEVGAILFGTSTIFQGENIVDELEREFRDFADTVRTMGYTNVSNSRAIKKIVRFSCRSLSFQLSNFRALNSMFRRDRTTYKCLWIPTPDPVDQDYTERFAAFAKLSKIPVEKHNSKGAKTDYTDLDIEVDESL